jgi:hypothetical protein
MRYYFNSKSGKCELFTYSGCYGNSNNFQTLEACENKCKIQLLFGKRSLKKGENAF